MRFVRVELCNWDIQANQVLVLQEGVNLLTGENGSGKTSLLDAIKVALGVTDLGADRSVDDYLRKRASPFAMVRLVADNQADPVTRRRPLDGLGRYDKDFATLAVVYEAGDEGYAPRWYLLDGDVSPLSRGFDGKPFTRKGDYLERLDRIGMGRSFRHLLRTPQGQIAGLCAHNPGELFDLLFDFIGGKQALEDWLQLRARFEAEKRSRQDRAEALGRRQQELTALQERLEHHRRYRAHLDRITFLELALPHCRALAARSLVDELAARHAQLADQRTAAADTEAAARSALETLRGQLAALSEEQARMRERQAEATQAEDACSDALTHLRTTFAALEALRHRSESLPARDLDDLEAQRLAASRAEASARLAIDGHRTGIAALEAERADLDAGLLKPPEAVEGFRAALRRAEVPHHLLLELVEPPTDPTARHALEGWLGDLRFAVAVPDAEHFVRAVALARAHHFPFHVLAPDIRSPAPEGAHPFLDAVTVRDPRYLGLVRRVLRNVDWLRGPVTETFRQRGAKVDAEGYVLDRVGGRFQGTDRYFLGRDALERRRAEVEEALRQLRIEVAAAEGEVARSAVLVRTLDGALAEERERRRWEAARAEHEQLRARVAQQEQSLVQQRAARAQVEQDFRALVGRESALRVRLEHEQHTATEQQRLGAESTTRLEALALKLEEAKRQYTAAATPDEPPEEVREHARRSTPDGLLRELDRERDLVGGFREAERDPNLPGNVRTVEVQVEEVGRELARLDAQVDEARTAADRAYTQYVSATKRIFRHYFGKLKESGERLGFGLEGTLRSRDDARFEVDLQVAIGDKAAVPYGSSSLSGGQKAALSILLAMTTLRLQGDTSSPPFFLVDEPFSASDVHKIQELGTFLDQTGAQYVVSMPSTSDLARCGPWLQAVLTCTQTRGGHDANGELRIAPPVKCSYVVRNGD